MTTPGWDATVTAQQPPARGRGGFAVGFIAGLAVAVVVGYALVQKAKADARRGWNLVAVVVAAEDVPAGAELTVDRIAQRSLPEQFVTASSVGVEQVPWVVGQKSTVHLKAGDVVRWSDVEGGESRAGGK